MQYEELTEAIINCAYKVYNTMGFGFLESVYKNALLIELKNAGLRAESEASITVRYHDRPVGEFRADILIEDTVILELKSVKQIVPAHEAQLVNYLTATGKPVGLLLNFAETKVQLKRKLKDLNQKEAFNS
jgi:GxxExxY protein